jgi:hypothetical protein
VMPTARVPASEWSPTMYQRPGTALTTRWGSAAWSARPETERSGANAQLLVARVMRRGKGSTANSSPSRPVPRGPPLPASCAPGRGAAPSGTLDVLHGR